VKVYLAGPISGCTYDEARGWRDHVTKLLRQRDPKIKVFDPMVRDYRGHEQEPEVIDLIVEQDKKDIDQSDVLMVCFDKPSVGTSMEVLYAWEQDVRILVINRSGKPLSPWLSYHSDTVVETFEQAVAEVS
jgi:nucleoside 2-deoxyribosyltransferase